MIISFEGIEGVGKSTQIELLSSWLNKKGISVDVYREPGSTNASEKIRDILLSNDINLSYESELLLMFAARAQLVNEKIINNSNNVFLFDRYYDASIAYQGYGRGLPLEFIEKLVKFTNCPEPKLTILLDLGVERGFERKSADVKDRIESAGVNFFNKVRGGYLSIAEANPDRVKVVDADQDPFVIHEQITTFVSKII